jgi:hypothetical protein
LPRPPAERARPDRSPTASLSTLTLEQVLVHVPTVLLGDEHGVFERVLLCVEGGKGRRSFFFGGGSADASN